MQVEQPNTVVIHAYGLVAAKSSNAVVQMLSKKLNFNKVRTIQSTSGASNSDPSPAKYGPPQSIPPDPPVVVFDPIPPVPLMSLNVQPPQGNCDVEISENESSQAEPEDCQASLFSQDAISEFSEEDSPLAPGLSPSPSISSFTSPSVIVVRVSLRICQLSSATFWLTKFKILVVVTQKWSM